MRGDSFAPGASQYIFPCRLRTSQRNWSPLTSTGANVNQTAKTNRTVWPLTGGSLSLDLHHPWTYLFINLGVGTNYPTFNISLGPLYNETGNGTLCLPQIALPTGLPIADGTNASIQVVTVGDRGSALYNVSPSSPQDCEAKLIKRQCADITFSATATLLSNTTCSNSTNVTVEAVANTFAESGASGISGSMFMAGAVAGVGALLMSYFL